MFYCSTQIPPLSTFETQYIVVFFYFSHNIWYDRHNALSVIGSDGSKDILPFCVFLSLKKALFTPFVRRKTGRTVARIPARQEQHVLASTKNEIMRDISTTQKPFLLPRQIFWNARFPHSTLPVAGQKSQNGKQCENSAQRKSGVKKRPLLDFAGVLKITFTLFAQNP